MQHNKVLPEPPYFTFEELMDRWRCDKKYIQKHMETKKLKASFLTGDLYLESGVIDQIDIRQYITTPVSEHFSTGELLTLHHSSIKELLSNGETLNPYFETDMGKYLRCSSNHYPSPMHPSGVIVRVSDLIFSLQHVRKFELIGKHAENSVKHVEEQRDIREKSLSFFDKYFDEHAGLPNKPTLVSHLQSTGYRHISAVSLLRKFSLKALKTEWHISRKSGKSEES